MIDRERRWASAAALLDALAPLLPDGSAIALEELAIGAPPAQRLSVTTRGKRRSGAGATERMAVGSQGRVVIHDEASIEDVGAASTLYASGATVLPTAKAKRRRWAFVAGGALAVAGGATVYLLGSGAPSRSTSATATPASIGSVAAADSAPSHGSVSASPAPSAEAPSPVSTASTATSPSAPVSASASSPSNGRGTAASARAGRPSAASATPSAARTVEIDTHWPQ